ncbi:hypothetical protein GF360_03650 [candidate division WWE3 bacterium]|nr:hypothetical protein [candidate division WWE3 bacterium]
MVLPIEWLKEYVNTNKSAEEIAETFTALGLMLDKPIEESTFGNAVLDLEHRMDRADWLSILGCARDFAAMEGLELKTPEREIKKPTPITKNEQIPVTVNCPELVSRFNTRIIKDIKVEESPKWMQQRLQEYGIPAINNIVDITNYVMVEYGQPLHAQDIAKFEKREIVIRKAKEDETLTTLDGTVIKLTPKMFVLTQNDKPITLGGIVGGKETAVTNETTDIVLDAGNYNQANIRHTARALSIRNETVLRSEKFLHPKLTQVALERAIKLILEIAGGECYTNQDWYPAPQEPQTMQLRYKRIEKIGGEAVKPSVVKDLLQKIDYEILEESKEGLKLQIPYFRTDVLVEDDIVSDVLRLQNYENIKTIMPPQAPPKNITFKEHKMKQAVREALTKIGADEYVTNPLVAADLEKEDQVRLENALSKEQSALRADIKETLGKVAKEAFKQGKPGLIFEVGRVYYKKGAGAKKAEKAFKDYAEARKVTAIQVPSKGGYLKEVHKNLKTALAGLFSELEIKDFYFEQPKDSEKAFIKQENLKLGTIETTSFSLDIEALIEAQKTPPKIIREHTNSSTLDFSLVVSKEQRIGEITHAIEILDERIKECKILEEYTGEEIEKGSRGVLLEVLISAVDLTGDDIQEIQEAVTKKLEKTHGVKIRK